MKNTKVKKVISIFLSLLMIFSVISVSTESVAELLESISFKAAAEDEVFPTPCFGRNTHRQILCFAERHE